MARSPFERDFADLHGRRPRPAEFIRHEDVRAGRLVSGVARPGLRLTLGALGLFWGVVLLGVLAAMILVAWAVLYGLIHPAHLGP